MFKKILICVYVVCSFSFVDILCENNNSKPKSTKQPIKSDAETLNSRVLECYTHNGTRFLFCKDTASPIVHIRIAFNNCGAACLDTYKAGLPEFYAAALSCGSDKYSKIELQQECSNIFTSFSADSAYQNFTVSMDAPKDAIARAAALFKLYICNPTFEKIELYKVQKILSAQYDSYQTDPKRYITHTLMPSLIFQDHSYKVGMHGKLEDFMKLSINDLKWYQNQYIVKKNAIACVFGDISEEEAAQYIDNILSGLNDGEQAKDSIKDVAPKIENIEKFLYSPGPQSTICFALKNKGIYDKTRYASILLNNIFGGPNFNSKLMSILRTKNGFVYTARFAAMEMKHSAFSLGIALTDNTKVDNAIKTIREIIKDLRENGVTQADLSFAKSNIKGSILVNLRTSNDLCNYYFRNMLFGFGKNILEETLNALNNVTLEEINAVAKELFDENNITIVVIGGNKK